MNLISLLLYLFVFIFSFFNTGWATSLFAIAAIYWIFVLAKYMIDLDAVPIETHISEATWFNLDKPILMQYCVSLRTYFTYPFAQFYPDGARQFFIKLYKGNREKEDIYAGNKENYYDIMFPVIDNRGWSCIIDLGCGEATLVNWLKANNYDFARYIGVDFAIEEDRTNNNRILLRNNVEDYSMDYDHDNLVICVNTLCYLSDDKLITMLDTMNYSDQIIVVEPKRSIFWEAYFDDVQVYYRSYNNMIKIFKSKGFEPKKLSISYGINKLKYHHFISLSYCIGFVRKGEGVI